MPTLADALPLLLRATDLELRATWFNAPWIAYTGAPSDDQWGDEWQRYIHPDDRGIYEQAAAAALHEQHPFSVEYRLRRSDGEYRWIQDRTVPIGDDTGAITGFLSSCLDITEQRAATQSQAYLAAIVESADDAIIAKSLDGIIQSCNATAERMFGYTAAELIGKPVRILIPPERQMEEDDILARLRRGEKIAHFETVRLTKTGKPLHVSLAVSPVRDASGRIIGASKIVRDITEQKRTAMERDHLLKAERDARADAERASRAKDAFVAVVSHELRTPLHAIASWAQLMRHQTADPTTVSRGIDVILRNSQLLGQVISDLLDVSRIVSGKLRLDLQDVYLPTLVDQAIATASPSADAKQIELRAEIDHATPPLNGDPARLLQIVGNLLSNAIKFTPSGGHVTVRVRVVENAAELTVQDDGLGIREEFLGQVFDRFNQADQSTSRRYGGLGLGLAIVKHLVELHGGHVGVTSEGEHRGSTFSVWLPLVSDPAHSGSRPARGALPADQVMSPPSLDGMTILVVDDERDTLEFVARFLQGHGAQLRLADSAAAAIAAFDPAAVDVVVSDIGLPGTDGYALLTRLSAVAHAAGTTVSAIALTAYSGDDHRDRAATAGYRAYLAKPVDTTQLLLAVARVAIERQRSVGRKRR
jgi:PAS domain S-box-containing protein